jgi:hypothetical protein
MLTTELARSEASYPEAWIETLERTRELRSQLGLDETLQITVDLNWDFDLDSWGTWKPRDHYAYGDYLSRLDSISISEYTPLDRHGWSVEGVTRTLEDHDRKMRRYLERAMNGKKPAEQVIINFGEFGIGAGGLSQPWVHFPNRHEQSVQLGIAGIVEFLKGRGGPGRRMQFASVWTVNPVFDLWGLFFGGARSPSVELMNEYNRAYCAR